ncbi:hypothetical protein DPMN_070543 [Dreissena polymorpha]|uniref:Uncharacterized protein n=1 Tax=Dreissena polymorpha TaxID=45954 RepID=A0A9D3Z6D5_DREPO|nr:hypothetical protein DPMN_070543 [Dreissena polymorpha]
MSPTTIVGDIIKIDSKGTHKLNVLWGNTTASQSTVNPESDSTSKQVMNICHCQIQSHYTFVTPI